MAGKKDLVFKRHDHKTYFVLEGKKLFPRFKVIRGENGWQTYDISGAKYGKPYMYRNDLFEILEAGLKPNG